MRKFIAQGAEAKLYLEDGKIIKERVKKDYRIKEIDGRLRKFRTRREAKVLSKLHAMDFPGPKLIESDDKEIISMEYIDGPKLRDILDTSNYEKISEEIGKKAAVMHNNHMIHGDLTTSNMIFKDEVYFIDFGLSFFSHKIEDKAVDLHLLKQALESKHYKIWEKCFKAVIHGYKKEAKDAEQILERLKQVEGRGRYKQKKKREKK
ncbi:Kae1-associated serine/threonine protein kinase [Candidatus Woesearchaeota archaeon]|nr:Kae1-associated serine/threonine protein kinase [Candidatus Woesearchaeota archaeon]